MSVGVVLVPGTHSWRGLQTTGQWWQAESPFVALLEQHGVRVWSKDRPFIWNTRINGLPWSGRRDWEAAALGLACYMSPALPEVGIDVPREHRNVIAHSHGGQVALLAAAQGLELEHLVTVATPPRRDLEAVYAAARPRIRHWLHIHSDGSDRWQWWGGLFDGRWGNRRSMPLADINHVVPRVGHSQILTQPEDLRLWSTQGWLAWLAH